jgi:hypothetical protein
MLGKLDEKITAQAALELVYASDFDEVRGRFFL